MHAYIYTHTDIHACMHTNIHTNLPTCMHACMHTYIHMSCLHTTYTFTYMWSLSKHAYFKMRAHVLLISIYLCNIVYTTYMIYMLLYGTGSFMFLSILIRDFLWNYSHQPWIWRYKAIDSLTIQGFYAKGTRYIPNMLMFLQNMMMKQWILCRIAFFQGSMFSDKTQCSTDLL